MPRQVSIDPAARDLYPEWPAVAGPSPTSGSMRAYIQKEPQLAALVGEDCPWPARTSRRLWADHQVKGRRSRSA